MIEVRVEGVLLDPANNSPVVFLRELDGDRVLPVFVGPLEAAAIQYALDGTKCPRPLTLDLMRLIIEGLGGRLKRTIVTKLEKDTFFAELVIESSDRVITIDCRPSDSIGLALRNGAPVYVAAAVMDKAGQYITPADEERLKALREKLRSIDPEDFGNYRV